MNSNSHDNIVQVTRTAAQAVSLIFTTVASNTTEQGNIINFVTNDLATGGVNGTDYKIVLADQTTLKIIKQNAYFNGNAFAVYQGSGLTGYVRGISYGVDLNTATSGAGSAFANPGALTSQEITGTITAQPATTLASGTLNGSLKIVGASDLTMQLNASLTLNGAGNTGTGGILKTGGGTSVMSGGLGTTGVVNLSNTQGDIRVDGLTDVLNISMPITWSGPTRLLKSGLGTLIFSSGTLPFTDSRNTMYINGGVFEIGGAALYNGPAANTLVLASGTTFRYNSSNVASFRSGSITGLGNLEVKAGALSLTSTANSYTGTTTLDGGILNVVSLANGGVASSLGAATNAASKLVFGGGTLRFNGTAAGASDRLFTIGDAAGNSATLDASGTTLAAFVNFSNTGAMAFGNSSAHTLTLTGSNGGANNLAAAIGDNVGATSITKTGSGSWLLSGANTYSGATTISAGTLEVAVGGGIGDASAVSLASVAGARLLVSSSETIGSLSGGSGANGEVVLGFNTLTLGDASSATFEGTIGG
ncbi:MAG: autotransporter-associated beta strand repeat-containing protein, partial [Verrucomicrobia bacterium]|nr:autotransporter-associated beta strand repeat-containing protein [Verrucomicrobiota bacterium]